MNQTLDLELVQKVEQWGVDRNIIGGATAKDQFFKLVSENGEWVTGVLTDDREELMDGIGDSVVVLAIMARQLGESLLDLHARTEYNVSLPGTDLTVLAQLGLLADNLGKGQTEAAQLRIGYLVESLIGVARRHGVCINNCLRLAYNSIKDRKGIMYNGIFIKSDDPRHDEAVAELAAKA